MSVRQTVILAAGHGSRLAAGLPGACKPLVEVAGRPLIGHALDQAQAAGCDRAVVVVGNRAPDVMRYLRRFGHEIEIQVVYNPSFDKPNGVSLQAAEPWADEWFYLQMTDHVFVAPVLRQLVAEGLDDGRSRLLVDPAPDLTDLDDATKVALRDGMVHTIGKELASWDAVDCGLFLLRREVFDALRRAGRGAPPSVSMAMRELIAGPGLRAVPLRDTRWADVDTHADLRAAEVMLGAARPIAVGGAAG